MATKVYELLNAAERIGRITEITVYNTSGPGLFIATPAHGGSAKILWFKDFVLKQEDDDDTCPPYEDADEVFFDPFFTADSETLQKIGIDPSSTTWRTITSEIKDAQFEIRDLDNALRKIKSAIGR